MSINAMPSTAAPTHLSVSQHTYQEVSELKAILDDPRFAELLDEGVIEISNVDGGYLVRTQSSEMQIDVESLGSSLDLHFQEAHAAPINRQALHPKYQTAREIRAILDDGRLYEKLGNEVIQSIQKTESGYVIVTRLFEIQVDVIKLPPLVPGIIGAPQRFELEFHDPVYMIN
jgi:hypothetical protein